MPYILATRLNRGREWEPMEEPVHQTSIEAGADVKSRNSWAAQCSSNRRYKVIKVSDEDPLLWRERERQKLTDGTYTLPPWVNDDHHYSHVDPDDPTKIRFIASDTDGMSGKYTSMSPGKFYMKYLNAYPDPGQIEKYCAKMGLDLTVSKLHVSKKVQDFVEVYTNGPHSCMSYTTEDHWAGIHPVTPYAELDLAVAWITRSGDITARCLVWPEKKIHGRIYGDINRMTERLKEEGYEEDWEFEGARLRVMKNTDGEIVAPYVDGDELDGLMSEDGEFIILSKDRHIILKSPDGVPYTQECMDCGKSNIPLGWEDDREWYVCDSCNQD